MPNRRAEIVDWLLLALVVLAVYGTLGAARKIFDALSRAGLEGALQRLLVVVLLGLAAAAVCWMIAVARVRRGSDYLALAGLGGLYAVLLLALSEMPIERIHLLEYGAIGMLAHRALRHRFVGAERAILAVLIAFNVGLGDEMIQGLLPRRFYDTKDVTINGLAGLLGVLAAAILTRARAAADQDAQKTCRIK